MDGPHFATVTFVSDQDGSLGSTFRVPITCETNVRQLAKDAMQRLVLSRRVSGGQGPAEPPPALAVSEVRVGGADPRSAEIFARDLVSQVVLVREEVIFMRLHLMGGEQRLAQRVDASAAPTRASSPAAVPVPAAKEDVRVEARPETAAGAGASCAAAATLAPASEAQTGASAGAEEPPARLTSRPVNTAAAAAAAAKGHDGRRPREESPVRQAKAARTAAVAGATDCPKPRGLGWGPEADQFFPANYCSSPDKLMRRRRAAAKQPQPEQRDTGESDEAGPPVEATAAQAPTADAPRAGWGPEAHKWFAANYVSSPDRLAREIRKRQQEERAKQAASGADTRPAALRMRAQRVARQLDYEEKECPRNTVGHRVERVVVVEDESPETEEATAVQSAPLPKGWGTEAAKYFDPDTYCDDPRKAKLTIADRTRPSRRHRSPLTF